MKNVVFFYGDNKKKLQDLIKEADTYILKYGISNNFKITYNKKFNSLKLTIFGG